MNWTALLPILLVSHVLLAVSLFLPSFLLPFTLRTRGRDGEPVVPRDPGRVTRTLLWLERNGTLIIGAGVALTGAAMLLLLGPTLLAQPWLVVALILYATILGASFFVQRPGLRRLFGLRPAADEAEKERWRMRARRQRYVSYAMAGGIGLIGWLMMAKPGT